MEKPKSQMQRTSEVIPAYANLQRIILVEDLETYTFFAAAQRVGTKGCRVLCFTPGERDTGGRIYHSKHISDKHTPNIGEILRSYTEKIADELCSHGLQYFETSQASLPQTSP